MENRMRKRMTVILNSKMNMRRFYVSAALLLTTLLAVAENNPYRSDVFWVTVPDHADWLYKTGEQANVEVQFYKYGIPGDSIAINFEIGGEMMPADTKGTVIMRKGKATIPVGTMKKPGFRDCRLTTTVDGKKYSHHVKVGFSPEKLRPYTTMPADFQQFWENEKAELAKFPLTYTKEHVKKYSTDQIDCYLIKLQVNQRGQSIYGYLFYPKKEGKYPVVLCPPGAGIKTIKEPLRHKYYAEQGCIRFEIEIHGLNPEMSEEEFKEISAAFNGRENGYLSNGLDSRDNYYMKRVYLACVLANIGDDAVAVVQALLRSQLCDHCKDMAQQCAVLFGQRSGRDNVLFGHHQKVHLGLRVDVVKRHHLLVLVQLLGGDFPLRDHTEQTIFHGKQLLPDIL